MDLKELLKNISNLSKTYKTAKPYLVGGIPRDIYLKIPNIKTTDIDITTNSNDSLRLGILFADKINEIFELSDDGHVTVFTDKYDVDFSSNFNSKRVENFLGKKLKDKKLLEVYSRDYTINTLHQDLDTGKIFDPIKMGFDDAKNKILRTPVPAEITLRDDPRRIYRAINLAARYDFNIHPDIITFAKNNLNLFTSKNIKDKYATLKINKALEYDEAKTLKLLKELNLFKIMPLSGKFKELLISKSHLVDYFK